MITACWNVFMIPISVGFQTESEATQIIDHVVDACFILDILFVFRTAYLDESGNEITNSKLIAKHYLKSRFWIDFLCTIPFDKIGTLFLDPDEAKRLALLGSLKMVRVLRLNKIIMYLNVKQEIKSSIRFFKMILFLLMYVHFIACIWYYIINSTQIWLPLSDYMLGWKAQGQFYQNELHFKYVYSFYLACCFLFGKDVGARDDT